MDNNEIETRVKKVIAGVLKMEPGDISSDANFIFDLGADSLQSMELVAGFDDEFDIEMDEDKALTMQTVKNAVDFISECIK